VLGHRLALARQATDPLEERTAVDAALRRIVSAIPAPV
jgi:Arc/MetJ family transcription regulator